jgi:hypothetical protein
LADNDLVGLFRILKSKLRDFKLERPKQTGTYPIIGISQMYYVGPIKTLMKN